MASIGGGSSSGPSKSSGKRKVTICSDDKVNLAKAAILEDMSSMKPKDIYEIFSFLNGIAKEKEEASKLQENIVKFSKTNVAHRLRGDCPLCLSSLLDDMNSNASGVTSFRCSCPINRLVHTRWVGTNVVNLGQPRVR